VFDCNIRRKINNRTYANVQDYKTILYIKKREIRVERMAFTDSVWYSVWS